jgi:hypothetical protein
MSFRHAQRLITAQDPEFQALYGKELAAQITEITASPEQQAAARAESERLAAEKRRAEAQLVKEICDGADNKVYGKEGQQLASRFPAGPDGTRDYYMQLGLRDALAKAGLLRRSGPSARRLK